MSDLTKLETIIRTALVVPMGKKGFPKNAISDDCVWGLPLLIWGSPGIGKSDRVGSAAESVNLTLGVIFPATRAPEDFSGVPVVIDGKMTIECIMGAVRDLCEKKSGVLFIDEISCAVPAVQAAMLGLILNRRVGDVVLPPGIRIISAANPTDEAAGGWDLAPPMANRFAHITASIPSKQEWFDYMDDLDIERDDIKAGEDLVKENWAQAWSKAVSLMKGFHKVKGDLYKLPPESSSDRGRAWPSPRTWEMATRAVATCYALSTPSMTSSLVAACVGEGQAKEWATWVKSVDLPDPRSMCLSGWTPNKTRLDITVAAVSSMVGYVVNQKSQKEKEMLAEGAWKVLGAVSDAGFIDIAAKEIKRMSDASLGIRSANKRLQELAAPLMKRLSATKIADVMGASNGRR